MEGADENDELLIVFIFLDAGVFMPSSSLFSPPPLSCLTLLIQPSDCFPCRLMLPTILIDYQCSPKATVFLEFPKNSLGKFFYFPLLKLYQNLQFEKLRKATPHTPPSPL